MNPAGDQRHTRIEQLLANVRDVGRRIRTTSVGDTVTDIFELLPKLLVDVVRQSISSWLNVFSDDLVARVSKLLISQSELDFFPLVESQVDSFGVNANRGRRSVCDGELTGATNRDRLALASGFAFCIESHVNTGSHAEAVLELNQSLVCVENGIVDPENRAASGDHGFALLGDWKDATHSLASNRQAGRQAEVQLQLS